MEIKDRDDIEKMSKINNIISGVKESFKKTPRVEECDSKTSSSEKSLL